MYTDFFQFTPPGADLLYLAGFRLFGSHIWVTNLIVLVLGVALVWICFSLGREILRPAAALLAAVLFLVAVYIRLLNGTHHWFAVLAVICALRAAMAKQTRASLLAAGALLGLASFFTQTHGAAACAAFLVFLICDRLRDSKMRKRSGNIHLDWNAHEGRSVGRRFRSDFAAPEPARGLMSLRPRPTTSRFYGITCTPHYTEIQTFADRDTVWRRRD